MAFVSISGKGGKGGPLRSNRNFHDEFDGQDGCGCLKMHQSQKPKKLTKIQLLKERIRQFSIWYFEEQEHIDKDFFRRRVEKQQTKTRHVSTKVIRTIRCLYALDIIVWSIGLVIVLCSSVESFGKNTTFYKSKHLYQIIGPFILLLGVLLLLFITGLKHKERTKYNKPRGNFYIVDKKRQRTCNSYVKSRKSIDNSKDTSEDSGNEEDIEVKAAKKIARHKKSTDDNKDIGTTSKRPPLYFYKNVDSRQCSFELSPIASTSAISAHASSDVERDEHTIRLWRDRRAWTKSKWMMVESEDSIDDGTTLGIHDEFAAEQNGIGDEAFAQYRRRLFQMKSHNTSSNDSDDLYHPINRNISTKSKISQASSISTCSETAPLVKQ